MSQRPSCADEPTSYSLRNAAPPQLPTSRITAWSQRPSLAGYRHVAGCSGILKIARRVRQGGVMRGRSVLLIAGLAIAGTMLASTPATAQPIDKGHFHDVFTSDVYDCDGTPAQDSGDVSVNFVFN